QSANLEPAKRQKPALRISTEEMIEEVRAQAAELGRTPEKKEFRHSQAVVKQFGSWRDFIERAGLEPAKPIKSDVKLSNEELIERVQAQAIELGRTPIAKEFPRGQLA
ncbi:homing endonuclease associated repeat-containing protein, partial [Enterococcus pallens]